MIKWTAETRKLSELQAREKTPQDHREGSEMFTNPLAS
jgi:hypothetical protein